MMRKAHTNNTARKGKRQRNTKAYIDSGDCLESKGYVGGMLAFCAFIVYFGQLFYYFWNQAWGKSLIQ